jgi:ADP-ribosyl-[dinitrogen reductase] hydrolase
MMVELAIGDAYGAGFEYAPADFVARHNTVERYVRHPTHTGIAPGAYTDDTQMTLAVAELLADGAEWTPLALAEKFVEVYQRDPRDGYAGGFHAFLRSVTSGREFLDRIHPDSDKSGAAMRVAPVGLLPSVAEVRHHAATQARVTHDTPAGIASAEAAALAVHYCHYALGPLADLPEWISDCVGMDWTRPWQGKVGSQGAMSVGAALATLTTATTMSDLLRRCVAHTGDVDTVATIALAAASRSTEVTPDLPAQLHDDLENGMYGRDYLRALDQRLLAEHVPG